MRKESTVCLILIIFSLIFSGCNETIRFLVCPNEYAGEIRSENRLERQREILYKADKYSIIICKKDAEGKYIPVQHYRPEHTFTSSEHPMAVTWEKPLHVSKIIIFDRPQAEFAIAVKKDPDPKWRLHLLNIDQIIENGDISIVYLRPLKEMSLINDR